MRSPSYRAAGPLLAGTRSSAMLGLEEREASARPIVLVWAPQDVAKDEERFGQLQRETRRAVGLDHPHIVKVHGLTTLEQGVARVVEFVDGESLRDLLEHAHVLAPGLAGRIAVDLSLGVHYAHVAGNDDGTPLVHGDLRPETVMLAFSGRAKVAGYGALAVAPKEPQGQRVVNRRRYCAPEQIIGGRAAQTPQTDVFLLGLVLYECLTGKRPWDGEADFDQAVMSAPLALDAVPAAARAVVAKATAKRASERYKTALAFRDAVDAALAPLATPAELANLLEQHFPSLSSPRAARKQVLEAALAAHARAWAHVARTPRPEEADTGPGPKLSARQLAELEPPVRDWRAAMPLVFGCGVAVALAGAFWYQGRNAVPKPMLVVPPGQAQAPLSPRGQAAALTAAALRGAPGASPAVATAPAGPTLPSAAPAAAVAPATGTPATPNAPPAPAAAPAPATAAVSPAVPAPPAAAGAPARPSAPAEARTEYLRTGIDLATEPTVDAALDGKPAGRSPLVIPATPGRHVLTLSDRARGIKQSRLVTVQKEGVTPVRVVVGKGTLAVHAPTGATVFVDGRAVGASPVQDLHLYEGTHHLKVTLGDATWQQEFTMRAEQTLQYNVELKPTSGG